MRRLFVAAAVLAGLVPAAAAQEREPTGGGVVVGAEVVVAPRLEELSPEKLAEVRRHREHFGLASDVATIGERLELESAGVSMVVFGMPLSDGELAAVAARQQFGVDVEPLLRWVERQPGFAGAAFRVGPVGGLDVFVTTEELASEVRARGERLGLDHPIGSTVVEHSWAELQEAMDLMAGPDGTHFVGIDTLANGLILEVDSPDRDLGAVGEGLERTLGVPVVAVSAPASSPQACNNRQDCWAPRLRPGARLTMGSRVFNSGRRCTMGFHVRVNGTSDEQFLAAGHCSRDASASTTTFHRAYHWEFPGVAEDQGRIGAQTATAFVTAPESNPGYDVARFQMPDIRTTDLIYRVAPSTTKIVANLRYPSVGDFICMSPSVSRDVTGPPAETIRCGSVTVADSKWKYNSATTCQDCWVRGARHSFHGSQQGDSGAPVWYATWGADFPAQARPVGLHVSRNEDATGGGLTRIHDALLVLGAHIALEDL